MKTIARTSDTHDIGIDSTGQIAMVEGKYAYALIMESIILTRSGELQLDTERGIPYFSTVFMSPTLIDEWANSVASSISELGFVSGIESFDYSFDGEMLKYDMEIMTDEGNVTISQSTAANIIIPSGGSGGGGDQMETLVDSNGLFYLPVGKVGGVQRYRQLKQFDDGVGGVTTQLSETMYVKDANGSFVEVT